MSPALARFLTDRAIRCPSGSYSLKDFAADFIGQLPAKASDSWRRSRLVAELTAAGFPVAVDPRTRTYVVGGLAPRGQLREVDGRLELATNVG